MFVLRLLTVPLLVLVLVGCSAIPVGSLLPLTRIDLMTTDLDRLRAALRLPTALRPQAAGVDLDVVLKLADQPDETISFSLVAAGAPSDRETLPASGRAGDITYVYRLASADIARFGALRQRVATQQATGRSGSLGFGIAAREFCGAGPLPAGPLLSSTYLLTSETGAYITLLEGFDLRGDAKLEAAFAGLAPC